VLAGMREPAKPRRVGAQRVQVETQAVRKRRLALRLEGVGTAQALRQVRLMPEVSGEIAYVSPQLRAGARVAKGALLVRIDGSQLAIEYRRLKGHSGSLQKQIKMLRSALALDQRHVARSRRLLRGRALDRGSYERQKMQSLDRQQRLESMRQSAANIRGQLRSTAWKLRKTRIRAPFDARVAAHGAERGGYASPGQPLATLESQHTLEIPVSFAADVLRRIKDRAGERVPVERLVSHLATLPPVKVTSSSAPGQVWRGRVVRVGAKIDLSTRTVPLWIRVTLRATKRRRGREVVVTQPTLLPGTFCRVQIPIRSAQEAVVIPKQALYSGGYTYLAIDNKISRRKVQVAHINGDDAILARGLRPGEELIVSPLVDPIEGTRVLVKRQ